MSAAAATTPARAAAVPLTQREPGYQAFLMLRVAFAIAPIAFGLDKFFNVLTDWPMYLAGWVDDLMPGSAQDFMYAVGAIEILAGVLVAVRPRLGAPIVVAWLAGIIFNLLTGPGYYDVALRDFGLLLGALTLTRLAFAYDPVSGSTFIVAGGGLAGAKAAESLREQGFEGRLILVGDEPERPYERPPLSKGYLRGEAERETIYVHSAAYYADHDIELRLGRRAVELDAGERELVLDDGEWLRYDRLLLATGAEPRRLPIPGAGLDGVLHLRSVADSDALRERLDRGGSVVVVGAGWIGCEVAASARMRGLEVTVVEPRALPLEAVLGPELGAVYRDIHLDHGVTLRPGTGVEAFEGAGAVERVRTSDGGAIDCDFVVVGVGVRPRTELAEQAGLATGNGIHTDAQLRTSAPGVFAAGDVAAAEHPFYGERIRVEHWANALEQGPVAAGNMLGGEHAYARLPYFFSDQYDVGMEYSGYARTWDRVVFRGDPAAREFIAFWLDGDRVVAGMNVNVWDVVDPIRRLIGERVAVDDRRLADPDVPLDELTHMPI